MGCYKGAKYYKAFYKFLTVNLTKRWTRLSRFDRSVSCCDLFMLLFTFSYLLRCDPLRLDSANDSTQVPANQSEVSRVWSQMGPTRTGRRFQDKESRLFLDQSGPAFVWVVFETHDAVGNRCKRDFSWYEDISLPYQPIFRLMLPVLLNIKLSPYPYELRKTVLFARQ